MRFHYQARDRKGDLQVGVVEASSQDAALQILDRYGFFVTFLEEASAQPIYARRLRFFERVSLKEVMLFSRQLSIMFKSQVSFVDALRTLASQIKNPYFQGTIVKMAEDIEAGTPFSETLSQYQNIFSPFYISIVKRGEVSGKLSDSLEYLADHLEREYYLSGKVRGALLYPAFIILVGLVVAALLSVIVLPNLISLLEESGQELPLVTKWVIALSKFMQKWWWTIFLEIPVLIGSILSYAKSEAGRRFFGWVVLKIPLLGSFFKMIYLSRFAENFSTLISGGLSVVQALEISSAVVGNDVYRDIIEEAKESVRQGDRISRVLQKYPSEFPPVFTQMVSVGEKSGNLDVTLQNVVRFYQKEVERTIENFLSLLEPVLIVLLGVLVGGLMAALILPLYRLAGTVL